MRRIPGVPIRTARPDGGDRRRLRIAPGPVPRSRVGDREGMDRWSGARITAIDFTDVFAANAKCRAERAARAERRPRPAVLSRRMVRPVRLERIRPPAAVSRRRLRVRPFQLRGPVHPARRAGRGLCRLAPRPRAGGYARHPDSRLPRCGTPPRPLALAPVTSFIHDFSESVCEGWHGFPDVGDPRDVHAPRIPGRLEPGGRHEHHGPRPRAIRGLDAARARPHHRAHAPDPRPPRGDRASRGRRCDVRHGLVAPRAGRPPAAVPARVAARAHVAVDRAPDPRRVAAPTGAGNRACATCAPGRRSREDGTGPWRVSRARSW